MTGLASKSWMTALALLCLALQGGVFAASTTDATTAQTNTILAQLTNFQNTLAGLNGVANPTQTQINAQATKLTALFDPKAVVFGTGDNVPKKTTADIKTFNALLIGGKPTFTVTEYNIRTLVPNVAYCSSGTGTFTFAAINLTFSARGTFCWKKVGTKWLISQLHSSLFVPPPAGK